MVMNDGINHAGHGKTRLMQGGINSKSKKAMICYPKMLALKRRLIYKASVSGVRFSPIWVRDSLQSLKRKGYVAEQWIEGAVVESKAPVPQLQQNPGTVKLKMYAYRGHRNVIKGFEKLDGWVVPKV